MGLNCTRSKDDAFRDVHPKGVKVLKVYLMKGDPHINVHFLMTVKGEILQSALEFA